MSHINSARYISRLIESLYVSNPVGTAGGIVFWIIIDSFLPVISAALGGFIFDEVMDVGVFAWMALGVFLFNIPLFFIRPKLHPEMEQALMVIERARAHGVSQAEITRQYRVLISGCVSNLNSTGRDDGSDRQADGQYRG